MACLIHHEPYVEKRQPGVRVELLGRLEQADVAFRDQVLERQATRSE